MSTGTIARLGVRSQYARLYVDRKAEVHTSRLHGDRTVFPLARDRRPDTFVVLHAHGRNKRNSLTNKVQYLRRERSEKREACPSLRPAVSSHHMCICFPQCVRHHSDKSLNPSEFVEYDIVFSIR
jgi:hypothetical protein